jgi:ribonuclease G
MTRKCPTCDGDGIVVSEGTAAAEVERLLRALVTPGSRAKAFKVELNAKVAALLVGPDGSRLRELEELTKRRFFFVGLDDVHSDHLRVLEQGPVEKLAPSAPVELGQELELKLGEVGLHDAHAGAGKVKGFEVVVAGAAKLVGKKVKVRVVAVMDDVAYAVLVGATEAPAPITAEAEAEKPTRARRVTAQALADVGEEDEDKQKPAAGAGRPARAPRARTVAQPPAKSGADDGTAPAPEPASADGEASAPVDLPAEGDGDAASAPKKRTRRGTRGGRNRRRKTAVAPAAEGEADEAAAGPASPDVSPAPPVIHLPDRDLGRNGDEPDTGAAEPAEADGGEAPKRPTRRGSRGGRNRRRKPAAAGAEPAGTSAEGTAEVLAAAPSEGAWDYTPMSEWGDAD